jgi:cystathionine beta-lyase/cystathionine gamma-synthase
MTTYPLVSMTLAEAIEMQFRMVDIMHRHFDGQEALQAGDYGAVPGLGRPHSTARVEAVLAELFGAEDAALVAGAGTGAIRAALMASLPPGSSVLVHGVPIYATTDVTFRAMGIELVRVDLNDRQARQDALQQGPAMVYLQHARQLLEDSFDTEEVVAEARRLAPKAIVMVDDNYAIMTVPRSGIEIGADLSAFSTFKLLGEAGVGCVMGRRDLIAQVRDDAYSGGSKIQGPAAVATMRQMVYAPVALAIQAQVADEVVERLNAGEVPGIRRAFRANHQECALLAELDEPLVPAVLDVAWKHGATTYPVGSQSRHETAVMVYRLSRAMCEADPAMAERMLRVNPFRAGADTVVRVLRASVDDAMRAR